MPDTVPLRLEVSHLGRSFGGRRVVDDLSLAVAPGQVTCLLGPSGCGKSTTLRMLTGNLAPSGGSVEICGIDLLQEPLKAKMHLGFLPEIPPLYIDMSVDAYLQLVARLHRIHNNEIPAALEKVKQRCGLTGCGKQSIKILSKGFQQRVGIAQAIIHDPDVIVLDEPTVGLDPNQMRDIRQLIRELGAAHSVILSTHILPEVDAVCDRVLIMHQGRIVYDRYLSECKQQSIELETVFAQLTQERTH